MPHPNLGAAAITKLTIAPVSRAAFYPYGQIIEVGQEPAVVNNGTALRHDIGDVTVNQRADSHLILSVFEAEEQRLPLQVGMLECHPRSSQTIVPMQEHLHLAIVCLPTPAGLPDLGTLRAFLFGPRQGVNYKPGVWHHPIVALGSSSLFFVQSWQDGSDLDCQEIMIGPVLLVFGQD